MSPKMIGAHGVGVAFSRWLATWYVARTPAATWRFYWRGFWRAVHPVPMGHPLPRPARDF